MTGSIMASSGGALDADATSLTGTSPGVMSVRDNTGHVNFGALANGNNSSGANIGFLKTRGTGTDGNTIVQSGDNIMRLDAVAADGVTFIRAGAITIDVDGTPGTSDMPGRITFSTTPDGSSTVAERMRIDNQGNVGIGTTAPGVLLDVNKTTATQAIFRGWESVVGAADTSGEIQIGGSSTSRGKIHYDGATNNRFYIDNTHDNDAGSIYFRTRTAGTAVNAMVITGAGNVGIGTTAPGSTFSLPAGKNAGLGTTTPFLISRTLVVAAFGANVMAVDRSGDGGSVIDFSASSVNVGNITVSGSSTVYNTSSDVRLKENVVPTVLGLEELNEIQVHDFSFISDPTHSMTQGFIAQELYEVYPHAVTVGGEDEKINPWSVDYGRITPLLVKAIQELDVKFVAFAANNGQWELDGDGYIVIEKLKTTQLAIAGDSTIGYGVIKAGDLAVTINNQHITSNSQVFVTFRDDLAGRSYYVSSVNDGSNFTVKLSGNLATDVYFSYWIVDSDNSLDAFKAAQESADEPEEPVIDSETPTSTATTTP